MITDNGNPYRSTVHAIACRTLGIRHIRTRPGAAKPTASRALHQNPPTGSGHGAIYRDSRECNGALAGWLDCYG
jgi:hypothetical protein